MKRAHISFAGGEDTRRGGNVQREGRAPRERMREAAERMPSWLVPTAEVGATEVRAELHLELRSSESGTRSKCSRRFM